MHFDASGREELNPKHHLDAYRHLRSRIVEPSNHSAGVKHLYVYPGDRRSERKWGFILTEQALCLHTVDYRDFPNFSNRFQKGLEAFLKVPGIGIDWMTAIGIRYVNLVVTKDNHSLKDYLDSWVLPTEPPRSQLSIIEGAYVARYKTDIGELRLQSMRNPQYTLPPELQSPLIVKNGWIQSRPETDFALIDIDHSITFSQPASIKTKEVLKHLKELRGISKEVFISVGTEFSHAVWR